MLYLKLIALSFIFLATPFGVGFSSNSLDEIDQFMFKRNLKRDSYQCEISQRIHKFDDKKIIKGHINYMDTFKGKYHYTARWDNDFLVLSTNIFLRNVSKSSIKHTPSQYQEMKSLIKQAQDYWNQQVRSYYPIKFEFNLVEDKAQAFFRPALINRASRGPYYAGWSTFWNMEVVAHEIAHMFGLDDEYENAAFGSDTSQCNQGSLMCTHTANTKLYQYHFHLISRRVFCNEE